MEKTDYFNEYYYICPKCKGQNIVWDAYARWDIESQSMELDQSFDDCWCHECQENIMPEEIKL